MKLLSKILLIWFCIYILASEVSAEKFSAKYKVSTKNITIGETMTPKAGCMPDRYIK